MQKANVAILLIDVINAFEFEGSRVLIRAAERVAPKIEALCNRAREDGIPIVYVNDNFGRWRSDFEATVRECTSASRPASHVCERLRPRKGDYFILKPQHSGFYSTPLELLLRNLNVETLILAGFAGNICVLFTANDAHMCGYHLIVPSDCIASNTDTLNKTALTHMKTVLAADTTSSAKIDFRKVARKGRKPRGQTF